MDNRTKRVLNKARKGENWKVSDLAHVTGYDEVFVADALHRIREEGLVYHTEGVGWNATGLDEEGAPLKVHQCSLLDTTCPIQSDGEPDCSQDCPVADEVPACIGTYGGAAMAMPKASFDAALHYRENEGPLQLTEDDPQWVRLCTKCSMEPICRKQTYLRLLNRIAGALEINSLVKYKEHQKGS